MICPVGGYPTVCHNELRDLVGSLLSEVCHDVAVEPLLQRLDGEVFTSKTTNTSQADRADVRAAGFWTRQENAFFDIRVFHANASSYASKSIADTFALHERRKQLEYEERIVNVDHSSFCPLVFSTKGGTGPLCERFLKRLGGMLAEKDQSEYSVVMAWLRCRIAFVLQRNAVMCICGSRSQRGQPIQDDQQLSLAESKLSIDA